LQVRPNATAHATGTVAMRASLRRKEFGSSGGSG
jgi:hypothetical protein